MNITKLEIVMHLSKYKKVSSVAEVMGIKQPTVTFHMKSLEEYYGVRLFEQRGGVILLTEAGNALLHYASKITALSKETERVLLEFRDVERGTITIGASYVPGTYLLPQVISQFSREYPGMSVKLMIKPAPVIQQLLLEHQIDLGFISSQPFDEPKLHIHLMGEDELVIVFSAAHRFAAMSSIDALDLAQEPFIFHGTHSTTSQMTTQWAAAHKIKLRTCMELDSLESIKRALMLGNSISFLSRQAVTEEVNNHILACAPLPPPEPERFIYACYHRERWLSKGLQQFLQMARENMGNRDDGDRNC
ncbi:LysR family transcriptional regulator [Brevibacillus panacihumi]|uniref:LysR family transcriptional regulator n=1 Tax=Brevibacillus panacihumi TaxID=497735 RepID=A0A3M8D439_9BACL|nr:LysR family transcriptional regulator [Brevibacillus panacihumi]RNB82850.1 LysR family transcriptional regulator [Brevibacillus panacihumi]